jgi:hypothetical protein
MPLPDYVALHSGYNLINPQLSGFSFVLLFQPLVLVLEHFGQVRPFLPGAVEVDPGQFATRTVPCQVFDG